MVMLAEWHAYNIHNTVGIGVGKKESGLVLYFIVGRGGLSL